jgi:hypothetical protein
MLSAQDYFDGFAVFHFDKRGIFNGSVVRENEKISHKLWE